MTDLMQEVDGFADQQNLERRESSNSSLEIKVGSNRHIKSRFFGSARRISGCVWVCVGVYTLRAWSMVMNEGIIDFLREYLSCHRRSVFTLGSDATKN